MKTTTNGRELGDAIDGVAGGADLGEVGDEHRLALAQALTALARCIDTSTDHELVLNADVTDTKAAVSISIGEKVVAPPEVSPPFEHPEWAVADQQRQKRQAAQDAENAEKFVKAWQLTHREQ